MGAQRWTSHNVALGDGRTTIPGREDFLTQDTRLLAIERSLRTLVGRDLTGLDVVDLGSLEGGFALALALQGASVTAIEARSANVAKMELLRDHFDLPNLQIVQADVKDVTVERYGTFELVLALGILYHLDEPVPWLHQLGEVARRLLILDTHMAPSDEAGMGLLRPDLRHLGPLQLQLFEGRTYEGRWFNEFPPTITEAGRDDQLWASWSNERSFWLTEDSLLQGLHAAGFSVVYEQHDLTTGDHHRHRTEVSRAMFVCARELDSAQGGDSGA